MKLIMIKGFSKTGKTTTAVNIIAELVNRGYSVGSVKDIHYEGFEMDKKDSDTWQHAKAGAATVTALGENETDILYKKKLAINEILSHYTEDYVVLEGDSGAGCINIVTGRTFEDLDKRMDEKTIAIAGVIANETETNFRGLTLPDEIANLKMESKELFKYKNRPIYDGRKHIKDIVDLIEERSEER